MAGNFPGVSMVRKKGGINENEKQKNGIKPNSGVNMHKKCGIFHIFV